MIQNQLYAYNHPNCL